MLRTYVQEYQLHYQSNKVIGHSIGFEQSNKKVRHGFELTSPIKQLDCVIFDTVPRLEIISHITSSTKQLDRLTSLLDSSREITRPTKQLDIARSSLNSFKTQITSVIKWLDKLLGCLMYLGPKFRDANHITNSTNWLNKVMDFTSPMWNLISLKPCVQGHQPHCKSYRVFGQNNRLD